MHHSPDQIMIVLEAMRDITHTLKTTTLSSVDERYLRDQLKSLAAQIINDCGD